MPLTEKDLAHVSEEVLGHTKPKKISQIRKIWPAIRKLTESDRTYKQIADTLLPRLGIEMTYRQFLSACWAIRNRRKSRRKKVVPSPKVVAKYDNQQPRPDPLEEAKRRYQEQNKPVFSNSNKGRVDA